MGEPRPLSRVALLAVLASCDGAARPPPSVPPPALVAVPPAAPSAPPPVQPEQREASVELRSFPVEGFGGRLLAAVDAVAPPRLVPGKDAQGEDELDLLAPIGAKDPVSCVLKPVSLDAVAMVRAVIADLRRYAWSARNVSVVPERSRLVLRAEMPFRDASTQDLLGVQRIALAVGPSGSIFCRLVDEGYAKTFARAADSLLRSASDFAARPARYVDTWTAETFDAGADAWLRSLTQRPELGYDEVVSLLHAEARDGKLLFREIRSEAETSSASFVVRGVQTIRSQDADEARFEVIRKSDREYTLTSSPSGRATVVRIGRLLTTVFPEGWDFRRLAASPSAAPVKWTEFGGLSTVDNVPLLRERVARRSGEGRVTITYGAEEETCHVAAAPILGFCDLITLGRRDGPRTPLRRVYATP